MAGSIEGVRAKIERAKKHIRDLDIAIFESNPYEIAPKFHSEFGDKGQTIYYVVRSAPIPPEIALISGDAVHNLRSALDHLVFQLGLVSGLSEADCNHLYFPICESAQKYKSEAPRKIKGIKSVIEQAINAVEPYQGGAGHGDTLWALHKLDISDKHRLLITVACSLKRWGVEVVWEEVKHFFRDFPAEIISRGNETVWYDPIPDPPDRHFGLEKGHVIFVINGEEKAKFQFTFDISFAEIEIVERKPIVETLSTVANVVENLVSDFAPFLL